MSRGDYTVCAFFTGGKYASQNRKYFHNLRFSPEEEKIIRERMGKYNYTRVSDFIRDAVLDKRLTQRPVVEIEPYKIDNNRLIPQVIDAIRTYDF